ncbi:MAG TPA: SRPBCC domain-containing protein [Planctomycetota bacterium]|nr:SRPBCC domain-containing protein [Planctomycetota bacterium]
MADILFDFPIQATSARVFAAVSTPAGLDAWWTQRSKGTARPGAPFELWFPPDFDWRARVTACEPGVRFELEAEGASTRLRFHHLGWPAGNEHYRGSCFCWAMYLRLLRRHVEAGETVPYEKRLDV